MAMRLLPWLFATLLTLGCASSGSGPAGPSATADTACGESDCFYGGNLRDFRVLDERTLVVWASSRRCPYVVELAVPCRAMRFENTIAFDSRDNQICSYGGDALLVRQGGGPARCSIANIRRISESQLEGLYVEHGLTDPAPTPPAEIEVEDQDAEPGDASS